MPGDILVAVPPQANAGYLQCTRSISNSAPSVNESGLCSSWSACSASLRFDVLLGGNSSGLPISSFEVSWKKLNPCGADGVGLGPLLCDGGDSPCCTGAAIVRDDGCCGMNE